MTTLIERFDRRLYPSHPTGWDDDLFRKCIQKELDLADTILDFGAGRGANPRLSLKGEARKICGVDIESEVLENPFLDEGRVLKDGLIPYEDETFDLVFSSYVLEHLEDPSATFREILRVLKPGGRFIARTPNRCHYVPLIASITPHSFHEFINSKRGRKEIDTFPTYYRANSRGQIRTLAKEVGFEVDAIKLFDGRPEYMRFNALTYALGFVYERVSNSSEFFAGIRPLLISILRKPA